ncbi:hypothetical protein NP493_844g01050 [Ridgeia piscesae]|uniref:RING-type domain-containing protein n=1 Tax=Ridgeia piscesae TaxID=27915 RepID=A0AAD9KNG5_RIDPI|nr:hypothetical protein NP493_844g01050 [Ridgeia piscesae]
MSWRTTAIQVADVLLRVPPLVLLDSLLDGSLVYWPTQWTWPWVPLPLYLPYRILSEELAHLLSIALGTIVFLGSLLVFTLYTERLLKVYYYAICYAILDFSCFCNYIYIDRYGSIALSDTTWSDIIATCLIFVTQVALACFYNAMRVKVPRNPGGLYSFVASYQLVTILVMLQPVIFRFVMVPPQPLMAIVVMSAIVTMCELCGYAMWQMLENPSLLWQAQFTVQYQLQAFGVHTFVELHWARLHVPVVLHVFWTKRFCYQLIQLAVQKVTENMNTEVMAPLYFTIHNAVDSLKEAIVGGCDTTIALMGMTSVVSSLTDQLGVMVAMFIKSDDHEAGNMGTMSAILFFILALQTGLTRMASDQRLYRLYKNACLLVTAMLSFIHGMIYPLLLNLSASRNTSKSQHARVLTACFVLLILPSIFLYYLWSVHDLSTWLLAVSAFCVEIIIKVFISLLLYLLFMIDTYIDTVWERLDDYVYYVKSTGNTIEFLFGIFLFGNGMWIMLFEAGGTIRAVMMCIHAYFNIWMQAKEGWKVFIRRRTASHKINALPFATAEQLRRHNDVCAICYQALHTARVTRCKHFFHGMCLRKWLYVQERCPVCHTIVMPASDDDIKPDERTQQPRHVANDNPVANENNIGDGPHNVNVANENGVAKLTTGLPTTLVLLMITPSVMAKSKT